MASKTAGKMFGWIYPYFGSYSSASSNRVPEEIQQDPYTLKLYRIALEEGKELDRYVRVNIVGNYGHGKTTLLRRILGADIKTVESTNAIQVEHYTCKRTLEGKLSYINEDSLNCSMILKRLVTVARSNKEYVENIELFQDTTEKSLRLGDEEEQIPSKDLPDKEELFEISGDDEIKIPSTEPKTYETSKDDETLDHMSESTPEKHSILSEEDKRRFAMQLRKDSSLESLGDMDTSVEFWDFGGQFIFYATHTMFHSRKAIYLLVLDLTSNLSEIAVDQDFPTESHERNMEYYVRFWLNSIHTIVGSEDGREPTVILVGTHKDKLKGNVNKQIDTYFENIRRLFDGTKLLNHLYRDDFAVDNASDNDERIAALREAIISIGNEKAKTLEIPAKWIQLERSLKEMKTQKIIKFGRVMEIDALNEYPLKSVEQVKLFLQYHHTKGTFIFFNEEPLSEHVVLDPQYLIDAFKCIITSIRFFRKDPEIRPLCIKLKDEARLEKTLIDKQWSKEREQKYMENREILLAFLTKHHIISEATAYDEDTKSSTGLGWFVVPSLLREQSPEVVFEQFLAGRIQTKLRFVMKFDSSTIVPTIYHRMVAATIGKWAVIQFRNKPVMYNNLCVVRLDEHHAGLAEMRTDTIELTVAQLCPLVHVESEQCDRFRRFEDSVIMHEFQKLKSERELYTTPYITTFRCNHESHGVRGSKAFIEFEQMETAKRVPCPDVEPHAIITDEARSEWYIDHRLPIHVPKTLLTEKILGKISKRIGHNWETLGHELGITHVQIEQIIEDHPNSTSMKIYVMVLTWLKQETDSATLDVLIGAMQRCPTLSVDWDKIRNIIDHVE